MAIVNKAGKAITNKEAKPSFISSSFYAGGDTDAQMDYAQMTNGDSIGSVYRLLQVPSNARMHELKLMCDAGGAGAKVDIGVYYPQQMPDNPHLGGLAINSSFFATAVDVSAALPETNVLNESGSNTIDKQQMTLAEALGLILPDIVHDGADPLLRLEICATVVTGAVAATGFLGMKCSFVD